MSKIYNHFEKEKNRMDKKEYNRNYYLANREKILAQNRENNKNNPEKKSEIDKRHYLKNRDRYLNQFAERYQVHKDEIANFNKTLEGKVRRLRTDHKSRAGYLDEELDNLCVQDIEDIYKNQEGMCLCCMKPIDLMDFDTWETDHIVPVCKGGHFVKHNIQLLCPSCHDQKQTKTNMYVHLNIGVPSPKMTVNMSLVSLVINSPDNGDSLPEL
jgi:5-methylcytosine-specific restriction endonuclease McrA